MIFFKKNYDRHFYLFEKMSQQSRQKVFYEKFPLLDSIDGRFELLLIHVILLIRKLRKQNEIKLSQDIVDLMFKSIDLSFREEGVGDLSIPKKMKKVGMVFYGRIENLDRILAIEELHTKHQELSNYFLRNAFLSISDYTDASEAFVLYTLGFEELLETLSIDEIEDLSFNASKFFT